MISARAPRSVVFVAYDRAEILDLTGPSAVFTSADLLAGGGCYEVSVVAPAERTTFEGGLVVETTPIAGFRRPVDTLVSTGGMGFEQACVDDDLVRSVRRLAGRSRRVASVCSGAFLLGAAGLLDGRSCTTHWATASHLADRHETASVEPDLIYVRDGDLWSSAGVTAGIDLALALVADDLGQDLANRVARWLVLPARRSGGQSQYSAQLAAASAGSEGFADLLAWMAANLDADLSVAALAARAGWGERHFSRRFKAEVGRSPARHVEDVRLDGARQLLETTDLGSDAIARRCGFASREVLHRAFQRRLGTTPVQYRRTFAA